MSVDVKEILTRGGRGQIDLLEFCVMSVNMDALFLHLVDEYRLRPQADSALALHDLFCAAGAPARISVLAVLPPKDVRIERAVAAFRPPPPQGVVAESETPSDRVSSDRDSSDRDSDAAPEQTHLPRPPMFRPPMFPPKYLFDPVTAALLTGSQTPWQRLQTQYDPDKTPLENLPGGRMTGAQRSFVDFIWTPNVRPRLVAAGFWKLATVA